MALYLIKEYQFFGIHEPNNHIIDKAHVIAKAGVKGVKGKADTAVGLAKKVLSEQKDSLIKDMNDKADRMEVIIQETRNKIAEKEEHKRRETYFKYIYERITAGDRFGFIGNNGWEELKLIKIWTDANYAVSTIRLSNGEALAIDPIQIVMYRDSDTFLDEKEKAERMANKCGLITVEEFEEIKARFEKQHKETEDKLRLIKEGARFGIYDPNDVDRYFSLEYRYTIDEENGLICAYETGISQVQYVYVNSLYVEGF